MECQHQQQPTASRICHYPRLGRASKDQEQRPKVKSALKTLIRHTSLAEPLQALINPTTPPELQRHVLQRLLPLLQSSTSARLGFVTSGALQRVTRVLQQAGSGTELHGRLEVLLEGEQLRDTTVLVVLPSPYLQKLRLQCIRDASSPLLGVKALLWYFSATQCLVFLD